MGFTYTWSNSYLESYVRDGGDSIWVDCNFSGLSTTTPVIDGTNLTEPASGYSRISHTPDFGAVASGRALTNDAEIAFATATADWGTLTHATLHNLSSAGNFLAFGALTSSEQVFDTDDVRYKIGDLTISLGGDVSNFLGNDLLDEIINGSELSPPLNFYVGFSTTAPNADGTNVTEPVGGAYGRETVLSSTSQWDVAALGSTGNTNVITFTEATGSWGTLTHWVIYDQSTGGNLLFFAALDASQAVVSGDQVKFQAGGLTISVT